MTGRVCCVLIAGLLMWSAFLPCGAGGGEATSGTGWNDGAMPPVFNPYVEDEAEETDEMRVVLFEGVSRDIPAYVLDGIKKRNKKCEVLFDGFSLDVPAFYLERTVEADTIQTVLFDGTSRDIPRYVLDSPIEKDEFEAAALKEYFRDEEDSRSGRTLFTPKGLISLYAGCADGKTGMSDGIPDKKMKSRIWKILPRVFEYFLCARRHDALRLEFLRRMEERRLMAELGVETEEILDRAPLYAYNSDQNGYYNPDGRKLRELKHKRNNPGLRKNIDDSSRWRNIDRAFTQMILNYWNIPEGASRDAWPQYVWEKERKMRSMEGEALSSPTHLLFLVETGTLLRSFAPEEAYRCMSLAWVRQCQAHRELSARIVEILRRSGLREDYARAVRKWGGRGLLHTPFPATRLGVFIKPGEVFEKLFNETYKFRSQVDF